MINLFTNYYKGTNPVRQKEIDLCLYHNLSNRFLNTMVLNCQDRLTFKFFFDKINKITSENDINIVANSDIYFDEGVQLVSTISPIQCYALSRWDVLSDGSVKHFNRPDSQDTWVFRGKIKADVQADFNMGFRGCDNRLAHELKRAGYDVINPSITIKSYHVQNSNIRNYNLSKYFLVPGPYHTIKPTQLP